MKKRITLLGFLLALTALLPLAAPGQTQDLPQTSLQCPDTYEPNDSFAAAWPLSPGVIQSYICDPGDADYYRFPATAGGEIHLRLYTLPADYNICLYDPAQNLISCSGNGGTSAEYIDVSASVTGDYLVYVYSVQGVFNESSPYTLLIRSLDPPDLVITDVWQGAGNICYQAMNQGESASPQGVYNSLRVDMQTTAMDMMGALAPGERTERCFSYGWQCSASSDNVKVCADAQNAVPESDETNNCQNEVWQCDSTAPVITSGPNVQVTQTTATITWTTDEVSDSVVDYGRLAGIYDEQRALTAPALNHQVLLKSLVPHTVYHFEANSTDASGNKGSAAEGFFETLPPADSEYPQISDFSIEHVDGELPYYILSAEVSDNQEVERVGFYLDDELLAFDYAGTPNGTSGTSEYVIHMTPAALGMSRADFFRDHDLRVVVEDSGMMASDRSMLFTPTYECEDINMHINYPFNDHEYFIDGAVVPAGEDIPIEVYASVPETSCTIVHCPGCPPGAQTIQCTTVEHQVNRVEFYANMIHQGNVYSRADHTYVHDWDIAGLGPGTFVVRADAVVSADCKRTESRVVTILEGEPELDVTREVTRHGNYFEVALEVRNRGTATTSFDRIADHLTGFQPVSKYSSYDGFEVTADCATDAEACDVDINVWDGGSESVFLGPDERFDISYLVVPAFYVEDIDHAIGEDNVRVLETGGVLTASLSRPCELTETGIPLANAVEDARQTADYLLVTDPGRLYATQPDADVNDLLDAMAELAYVKNGVLGYLNDSISGNEHNVKDQILLWGDDMRGSDGVANHFTANGYLLLVGEVDIVASWHRAYEPWWGRARVVHETDLPYGHTAGHADDPQIIVGRIIGDTAAELIIPIQTSINVLWGEIGYGWNRSDAFTISGAGDGAWQFENNVEDVTDLLNDEFAVVQRLQRDVEDAGGSIASEFLTHAPDKDVIFYRDHCNHQGWTDAIYEWDFPVDFGDSNPFAFANCCQAGRYENVGSTSIAEEFLQHGTAVYIGSTENSHRSTNNDAAVWFFDHWVGTDKSIGQVFKELKGHLSGFRGDHWSGMYNLYGDPKFGSDTTVGPPLALPTAMPAAPLTTLQVTVPAFEVVTDEDGFEYVTIPDGLTLFEEGQPLVPFYPVRFDYPAGYTVQDVTLTSRDGLSETLGIELLTAVDEWDAPGQDGNIIMGGEGWWPQQPFSWAVTGQPDGSTTLLLDIFPFFYNQATTGVEFYQNFTFAVDVVSSTVQITYLAPEIAVLSPGEIVEIELDLGNASASQDVIIDVVVKDESSDALVQGLLLETLPALSGPATMSLAWDSAGTPAGDYRVEARVIATDGRVLDRANTEVHLGMAEGEITTFTATPDFFVAGEAVAVNLNFQNMGTVPISGTAIIEIQSEAGEVLQHLERTVPLLAPGAILTWDTSWDSSGAPDGRSFIIGTVLFAGQATPPQRLSISTYRYFYQPAVYSVSN